MLLNYYDNKSNGPPLLFIHGTASSSLIWSQQLKLFGKLGFRVISVDLRGHGGTANPGGQCTLDDHLNDISETLNYINNKKKLIIIGHSYGAVLAMKFAERYSRKVKKLLLVSLPAKVPRLICLYYKWLLGAPAKVIKTKLKWLTNAPFFQRYKCAVRSDLSIMRQIWRESLYWDFLKEIPRVKCPSHFCVGKFDQVAPPELVKEMHLMLPNSYYKEIEWAAHSCMEDQPNEFNSWIINSLGIKMFQGETI